MCEELYERPEGHRWLDAHFRAGALVLGPGVVLDPNCALGIPCGWHTTSISGGYQFCLEPLAWVVPTLLRLWHVKQGVIEMLAYETAIQVRADEILSGDILNVGNISWDRVIQVRYVDVDAPGCSDRVVVTVATDAICCTEEYRVGRMVTVIPGPMRRKD